MEYTTLRSTFGGINTIKYRHIGTQSAVVYDFYSTIIELVRILVRFKIKIPQRWYFLNSTMVYEVVGRMHLTIWSTDAQLNIRSHTFYNITGFYAFLNI